MGRQMKFASAAEKENIGSGRSDQGHKSRNDFGQSQNLPSGRGDEQDPAADAERCKTKENLWAQSKRRQDGVEQESFETGFQPGLGVWVDRVWGDQSKRTQEGEEQESFETGFQPGLGVWVDRVWGDCGFPESS